MNSTAILQVAYLNFSRVGSKGTYRCFLSLLNWCHKVQGCSHSTTVKLEPIKMGECQGYLTNTGCQANSMFKHERRDTSEMKRFTSFLNAFRKVEEVSQSV